MFTLFIGTESDRNGDKIDARVARTAIRAIKLAALKLFGGYSISSVDGGWIDPKTGLPVEEIALRLELIIDGDPAKRLTPVASAFAFAQWCAGQLNQSAVLLVGPGFGPPQTFVNNPFPNPPTNLSFPNSAELEAARVSDVAS